MKQLLRSLFKGDTDEFFIQLCRYAVVGGIAFVADWLTLWCLTEYAGVHHLVSAAVAFMAGLTVNYLLSIRWVFHGSKLRSRAVEFLVFALIGVIGLGLNELVIWMGTDILGLHYMLSKAVSTVIVFFWNFIARRTTLFK